MPMLLWAVGCTAVCMVVPNVACFLFSIDTGLLLIDWFYPWPQNHAAFIASPSLIRTHVVANGVALLTGLGMVALGHDHARYAWLLFAYLATLVPGSIASVVFSARNPAHKFAGTLSFVFMALGSVVPAVAALVCHTSTGCAASSTHRWVSRSVAALFGAGVLFRVFAVALMPMVAGAHKREAWLVLIWAAWWIPSIVADLVLG